MHDLVHARIYTIFQVTFQCIVSVALPEESMTCYEKSKAISGFGDDFNEEILLMKSWKYQSPCNYMDARIITLIFRVANFFPLNFRERETATAQTIC